MKVLGKEIVTAGLETGFSCVTRGRSVEWGRGSLELLIVIREGGSGSISELLLKGTLILLRNNELGWRESRCLHKPLRVFET
jgi:hypothetical protein